MTDRKLYDTLGIGSDASPEDVKAAYRRAAMAHHPDRNPGDEEAAARFRAVQEAYDVLSDPEKRAAYDRTGEVPNGNSPEAALHADAINVFVEAIGRAGPNPSSYNIVELMETLVRSKQETLRRAMASNAVQIRKLDAVLSRIGRKEGVAGPNVLRGFLEQDLAAKRQQDLRLREALSHGEKLFAYVQTYTFEVEPPAAAPSTVG